MDLFIRSMIPGQGVNGKVHLVLLFLMAVTTLPFFFLFHEAYLSPKWMGLGCLTTFLLLQNPTVRPPRVWILIWVWPILSLFWARHPGFGLNSLPLFLFLGSMAWLPCLRPNQIRLIRLALFWLGILTVIYGMVQVLGWDLIRLEPSRVPVSFQGNSNRFAQFLLAALFLGKPPHWARHLRFLLLAGLFLSGSKLAIVTWGLGFFWLKPNWRAGIGIGLVFIGLGAWSFAAGQWQFVQMGERAYRKALQQQSLEQNLRPPQFRGKAISVLNRVQMVQTGLHMAPSAPIWGWGIGQFQTHYPRFAENDPFLSRAYRVDHAHNFVLEWGLELGWVWLLLVLILLGRIVFRAARTLQVLAMVGLLLALFDLAYCQPFFLPWLVLLWPRRTLTQLPRIAVSIPLLLCGLLILIGLFQAQNFDGSVIASKLDPARTLRARTQLDGALLRPLLVRLAQVDPYAPDSLHILALLAPQLDPRTELAANCLLQKIPQVFPAYLIIDETGYPGVYVPDVSERARQQMEACRLEILKWLEVP
ncbi:MAG: O-antigen ligase family protein [Acidobacteria bacterium]|nr:O-antigen ligase family protein [Acidobacteriota bacterium]MCB9397908.1 O-antigen ligase family protein [Acidobacteriota bacterium]